MWLFQNYNGSRKRNNQQIGALSVESKTQNIYTYICTSCTYSCSYVHTCTCRLCVFFYLQRRGWDMYGHWADKYGPVFGYVQFLYSVLIQNVSASLSKVICACMFFIVFFNYYWIRSKYYIIVSTESGERLEIPQIQIGVLWMTASTLQYHSKKLMYCTVPKANHEWTASEPRAYQERTLSIPGANQEYTCISG